MRGARRGLVAVLAAAGLGGCSQTSSDVAPEVDNKIRDNLSRPLSADELKQMGGGQKAPDTSPQSGPAPIPPGKPAKGPTGS